MKRLLASMIVVIMAIAARVHGQGWLALGTGMNDWVNSLAVLPNGDLIAGGGFTTAGGVPANRIARWNGTSWSALGRGMRSVGTTGDPIVYALAVLPNGDVIASGTFNTAGEVSASGIARWNGTSWSALGTEMMGVTALAVLPSGDLIAGGSFATAGGVEATHITRWNGTSWSALGTAMMGGFTALAVLPSGDLIAGGFFTTTADGVTVNRIARWNGTSWSALGTGMDNYVLALAVLPNGDLIAAGSSTTTAGGVVANSIARWNGTSWSALGTGMNDSVSALAVLPNGDLIVGGDYPTAGDMRAGYIARWFCSASLVSQPVSVTRCAGESATFAAAGSGIVSLQWRKDGVNIPGATSATYTIPSVRVADAGSYDCVATALCGIATSSAATLTVKVPQVLTLPASQTLNVDQPVFFALETNPESPCAAGLAYQWQRRDPRVANEAAPNAWLDLSDGGGVLGTRSATLAIFRPAPGLATGYRCKITNACGCEADSNGVIYTNTVNFTVACPADFNADGGIDFGDIEAFFERWENGC